MPAADFLRFVFASLVAHRLRSFLTALGICVGITRGHFVDLHRRWPAAVRDLGVHPVRDQLHQHQPGQGDHPGMSVGVFGSVRPLSLDDAEALRRVPQVLLTNAGVVGNAEVNAQGPRPPSHGVRLRA